ncbi:hypothetical protein N9W89_07540 [Hellea sp.]|nr:hypothetical protein [Hellea sp.]
MSDELLQKLLDKTDALIKLQAANAVKDLDAQKDKIKFLANCGMRPVDIAEALGTSANTVNVSLARIRKGKSKP